MEDSLKRLDKLTQEEVRMATAQVLKVTHTIDEGVRGVADKVVGVDDRVASVKDRVAGVDRSVEGVDGRVAGVGNRLEAVSDRVADFGDRVRTVDNKIAVVIEGAQFTFSLPSNRFFNSYLPDGKEARVVMQQTANEVDQMKRWSSSNNIDIIRAGSTVLTGNQLRQDLRRWLSPPDPSTNHNIACNAHHEGTAAWFFQGRIFGKWKTTDSLLWVHGKRMFSAVPPNDTI